MKVKILHDIPGLVDHRVLRAGDVADVPTGTAVALVRDGLAAAVRETPATTRETATVGGGKHRQAGEV